MGTALDLRPPCFLLGTASHPGVDYHSPLPHTHPSTTTTTTTSLLHSTHTGPCLSCHRHPCLDRVVFACAHSGTSLPFASQQRTRSFRSPAHSAGSDSSPAEPLSAMEPLSLTAPAMEPAGGASALESLRILSCFCGPPTHASPLWLLHCLALLGCSRGNCSGYKAVQ